jgi:mannose-1-phosphate guanylyltransferase
VDLVAQPRNLGTGPGLLLPLHRVLARAPEAPVVVMPSDHHYRAPRRLLAALDRAVMVAAASRAGVCLLGAQAEHAATDLGWIVPGAASGPDAAGVGAFVEKPSAADALALHRRGALWNTFVMVGSAARLWTLCRRHLPEQTALFDRYADAIDGVSEEQVLRELYQRLAPADFSRQVLARAEGLSVLRVMGAGWCDWGTPERLIQSLAGTSDLLALQQRIALGPRAAPHREPAPARPASDATNRAAL